MSLTRYLWAVFAFVGLLHAQEPASFSPFTYFVDIGGGQFEFAVGDSGDIWAAGVSVGHEPSINDPDETPPPQGTCLGTPTTDPSGNVFGGTGPCTDVYVMRLAGDGSGIVFARFVGGSGVDAISGITVDRQGNAYLVGTRALSANDPADTASYLIGLAADGKELFDLPLPSSFRPTSIALDEAGDLYIGGGTRGAIRDAVALKIDGETRQILYQATLSGANEEQITEIVVGPGGRAYVTGATYSLDLPATQRYAVPAKDRLSQFAPEQDVFLASLAPSGEWSWVALVGGSWTEKPAVLELIDWARLLVVGDTISPDFPWLASQPPASAAVRYWSAVLDPATGGRLDSGPWGVGLGGLMDLDRDVEGKFYVTGPAPSDGLSAGLVALTRLSPDGEIVDSVPVSPTQAWVLTSDSGVIIAGRPSNEAMGYLPTSPASTYFAPVRFEGPGEGPRLAAVLDAAVGAATGPSPGAVLSLYGNRLGPPSPVGAMLEGDRFPTVLEGVRVLMNGQPAPLLFVSGGQINAVVPFSIPSESLARIEVERDGILSNSFFMPVLTSAPQVFGAVLNEDGSLNTAENLASVGSIVSIWATGVGKFSPALNDGEVVGLIGPYPQIAADVSISVYQTEGDVAAPVHYAGAAPGLVAGVAQINFQIPEGAFFPQSPVTLRIGGVETRIPVFLAPSTGVILARAFE